MDVNHRNNTTDLSNVLSDMPALWGGIECSITRIKGKFQDQLELSGHYNRPEDIDLVAKLGVKALRFPLLYEKHVPVQGQPIDWSWAEDRLRRLRDNNITVIAGLVHHGSGPAYTNLLSKDFATGLASYAGAVARKFPHLEYYTPVNEPLTTARFSGLYGLWYPHHNNDRSFCRMLLNELAGVVLSMREIRKVNPHAKLIQTEDLGKVYAVKNLQYQANFENERRWITFDLLCGRVDPDHFLWQYFIDNGITPKDLQFFLDNPCPPDIMGLNYYVTSERFLDDNVSAYPPHMHGGNNIEKYVDTEAVRVDHDQQTGLKVLLNEVNDRYSLPMALTEVHIHCTREEQMRWFKEVWEICCEVKKEGVNLQAVTAWSLFGAYGWNKLLTTPECDYEPGVFDLRSPQPRETALAELIRAYASHTPYNHPVLDQPGWWKRNNRFFAHFGDRSNNPSSNMRESLIGVSIIGEGTLCNALSRLCHMRAIPVLNTSSSEFFSLSEDMLRQMITSSNSWAVIYAGEYSAAETNNSLTDQLTRLALICKEEGRQFLKFSQNVTGKVLVSESDITASIETAVLKANPSTLLIRPGLLFGLWDDENFAHRFLDLLYEGETIKASENTFISYSYVPDLVNCAIDLLIDGASGVCHLVHPEKISLFDFASELCRHSGLPLEQVIPSGKVYTKAPLLNADRFQVMPSIYCSIEHFVKNTGYASGNAQKVLVKKR